MTLTNETSIWFTRSNHEASAVLRKLITSVVDTADTEHELNISAMKSLGRLGSGAWGPQHDRGEDRDGECTRPTRGQDGDILTFDKIQGNLAKRGHRALMCWTQEPGELLAPESERVYVCVYDIWDRWEEVGVGGGGGVCHPETMSTIALGSLKTHFARLTQNKLTFWKHTSLDQREN